MEKVREVIIVEGRYDKNTVLQCVDATVVETGGFSVFSDGEKLKLIRKIADERGIIIFTDGDGAGFVIRNYLKGAVNADKVKHAYIPDVYGREKRKRSPSKEGKLGVEGMPKEVIIDALRKAGATFEGETRSANGEKREEITKAHLFELGLSGGKNSAEMRKKLLGKLGLPERMSSNAFLDVLNIVSSPDELSELMREIAPE